MTDELFPLALLAGGLATRLRPLTERIPKSLVELDGEPFIAHQLRLLRSRGLRRVVVCAGHLGEQIEAVVGGGAAFGLEVSFSYDGPRLLGTAGALRKALPALGGPFFVLYGDSYLPCDYRAVQDEFLRSGSQGLMTVFRNEGRWETSNVEFADGRILAYDKVDRTDRMRHVDYGLGVLKPSVLEDLVPDRPHDLAALYGQLVGRGQLAAFEVPERFYEIGSPEGLRQTSEYLARTPPGGAAR